MRKEFFLLLLREILDPKYGMFKRYPDTNLVWFAEDAYEDESMYLLIGETTIEYSNTTLRLLQITQPWCYAVIF